ncbi:hypothetical protein HPP92_005254 [Vanilla planifolia]|uniref:Uncharacterized protein n=1 Tax=Vanilla planifolia TaxID=51239 RepID=A0A835VEQ1_VANPL|nr:hypothetical protein HPP92_005254 [Vanilla planifolia]
MTIVFQQVSRIYFSGKKISLLLPLYPSFLVATGGLTLPLPQLPVICRRSSLLGFGTSGPGLTAWFWRSMPHIALDAVCLADSPR